MPLRMEGESRKKCEGYCSEEALYLFLSSVTKLYCLNKALLFIKFVFFYIIVTAFLFHWIVHSRLIKHKSESWHDIRESQTQTHSAVKYSR